ncbi:MAG: SGNH/GDSL hydrolase family protein [Candidatus Glassbacteria bacterium]
METETNRSSPGRKLLLPVIPLLVLLLLELLVRVAVSFLGLTLDIVVIHPNLGQEELKKQIYINDRYLLWRMKPNLRGQFVSPAIVPEGRQPPVFQVITNSAGFAGAEFSREKRENALRIVCMGNSSTFGWGAHPDSCYPRLLEHSLSEKLGRDVEVINAGVPGYTSLQGLTLFKNEILKLSPDAITLAFGANDCHRTSRSDSEIIREREGAVGAAQEMLSHIYLYKLLRYGIVSLKIKREFKANTAPVSPRVSPREFRAAMKDVILRAKTSGADVFLVEILPTHRQWDPYRKIHSQLSTELEVPLLCVSKLFDEFLTDPMAHKGPVLSYIEAMREKYGEDVIALHPDIYVRLDMVHPNSLGHLLIADALSLMIEASLAEGHY